MAAPAENATRPEPRRLFAGVQADSLIGTGVKVFLFLTLVSCLILLFVPPDWTICGNTPDEFTLEKIVIVRFYQYVYLAAVLFSLVSIVLAVASLRFRSLPFKPALWLFPLLLCPASCAKSLISHPGDWSYGEGVTGRDGRVYYLLYSVFLQGQTLVIGRLERRSMLLERFDVLVETNGDHPRTYMRIVRPADPQGGYGEPYLTPQNWLIYWANKNEMQMAYDLNLGKAYTGDELAQLSPFIILGQDARPNIDDFLGILDSGGDDEALWPREEIVAQEFAHKNPEVRALAKKLIVRLQTKEKAVSKTRKQNRGMR